MDKTKTKAIEEWPIPANRKGVQCFLGFCNFYRKFIRNFSSIVKPLNELTRITIPFSWNSQAQKAFEKLKEHFVTAPILSLPDPSTPYSIEVDASNYAIGAVLSQKVGDKQILHPVAYFSRTLTAPERNYDVGDRELLAIKMSLEEWRHLLEGSEFPITIFTDHKNLEYLQKAKRLKPRQARWALFFCRFNLHITHRPGSKNGKADALSRMNFVQLPDEDEYILPKSCFVTRTSSIWDTIKLYSNDIKDTISHIPLQKKNGYVFRNNRIVVPQEARLHVLQYFHDTTIGGHTGFHKTLEVIKRSFWWPYMKKEIRAYVHHCPTCLQTKSLHTLPQGLLQPLPIPKSPWTDISMDFITELPMSSDCNTIMVIVDRFSKMAHFIPVKSIPSATKTAHLFIKNVFSLHGLPETITTDRGTQFTSRFWSAFCKCLHRLFCISTAFHPQTNGQTERVNGVLEQYLRCFITHLQNDWIQYLPIAEFTYNNQKHSSTGMSPFFVNHGRHPIMLPGSPILGDVPSTNERIRNILDVYKTVHA
uniref:Gypsy retrotransposon integrase-like protein 1 n=1 Tax=Leptobrachium leishanense TaxID=445787 RepID=A0A8C5LUM7_9ANUR